MKWRNESTPSLELAEVQVAAIAWQRCRTSLSVRDVVHIIEASLLVLVFVLAFTGKQPLALDVLGRRCDLLLVLVSLAILAVFYIVCATKSKSLSQATLNLISFQM